MGSKPLRLRIESKGTPNTTYVYDADTGVEYTNLDYVRFAVQVGDPAAEIEVGFRAKDSKWNVEGEAYGIPQTKPIRVGFVGKMASGKTTLANVVMERYDADKLSFAKPVKEILEMVELGHSPYNNLLNKATWALLPGTGPNTRRLLAAMWLVDCLTPGLTKRERLQRIGTDSGRSIDKDIWVRHGLKQIEDDKSYVVDDVRFENEAEALKKHGFTIIELYAPNKIREARIVKRDNLDQPLKGQSHPSETEMGEIASDARIRTDKAVEISIKEVEDILEKV